MLTPIRYYRLLRGWKAAEVARRLEISPSYWSRIESGRLKPPLSLRRRIAGIFQLSQTVLFGVHP